MKPQRINLFKYRKPTATTHFTPTITFVVILVFCALFLAWDHLTFRSKGHHLRQSISQSTQKLEELSTMATLANASRTPAHLALNNSFHWSLFLWHLSAISSHHVTIHKIECTLVESPENKINKKISIFGEAKTVDTLSGWVFQLARKMPSYDFSLLQQKANEPQKPLKFNVMGISL